MAEQARMSLPELGAFWEDHLVNFIMPFWMKHAIDEKGGICTCIRNDGSLVNHDKLMWSQLRAIYTFSALYSRIEQRQEWLDVARQLVEFTSRCGRNDKGEWIFSVDRDGNELEGAKTIYVDGFAVQGLAEYVRVTGDDKAKQLALDTFESMQNRLATPGSYPTWPYPIPDGMKAHGVSMICSYAYHELAKATGDQRVRDAALEHANMVLDDYRKPDKQALMEYVALDGSFVDSPEGRCVVPGHAIESMWFQIHQYQDLGMPDRVKQCVECIRWHIEKGWDPEYGGIMLGMDVNNQEPVYWKFHDTKLWWPVTETLYALLLAHTICGEDWCMEWYWKVHDIAMTHYPSKEHGEWIQKLDRQFNEIQTVVALPVKDPFHLPRALIMCVELLRNIK